MAYHAPWPWSGRRPSAGRRTVRPRTHRPIVTSALAVVASLAVVLVGVTPVHAEPSVAEIEKQIDQAWNQLEPIIEKHNATRQDLAAKKKRAEALDKKIRPLRLQVELEMNKVGQFAARAYKGGNTSAFNAILSGGSPAAFIRQLEVLDQFARRQQEEIQSVVELEQRYAAQKAPLDALVAQLSKTEAELAAKKKQIDAEIARLQKLRLQAYGSTVSLGSLRPAPCPATYPGGAAGTAVKFACAQIGKPYVWAADGPDSYDCSGLTMTAWGKAAVYLPHNAAAQRRAIPYVSRANLRPGDLVFYYSDLHHVGMYVGDGWIVHASQAGVPVKMARMDASPIHSFGRPG